MSGSAPIPSGDLVSCRLLRDIPVFIAFVVFPESSRKTGSSPNSAAAVPAKKFFDFFDSAA